MRIYFLLTAFLLTAIISQAQTSRQYNSSEIKIALKKLNTLGTVLYVAAHPDDENTRLLSYLAKEKCLRTCYLSLNRGDGGQNLIGREQGDLLGLIRTHELLEARKIDGAEQFFTHVTDFGYSKTPEETFKIWGHDTALASVVWLIRSLKPDVIITRFPTTGEGGHGHHTASAILAGEAFKAAADKNKFSYQLRNTETWQPKSLWWNTFNFGSNNTQNENQLKFDVGIYNPLLGMNYGEVAALSRSQHKSQGFGVAVQRGKLLEYFKPVDGDTSCKDLFCNIDFSWTRIKASEKIISLCEKALNDFNPEKPSAILPVLIDARKEILQLKDKYWREQKLKEIDNLIILCSGAWFEITSHDYYAASGDSIKLKLSAVNYSGADIKLNKITYSLRFDTTFSKPLSQNELFTYEKGFVLPETQQYTNPFWLNKKHTDSGFVIEKQDEIGKTISDATVYINLGVKISGCDLTLNLPVKYKWTDPVEGEKYRAFSLLPPATINFEDDAVMLVNNQSKKIKVVVKSISQKLNATVKLQMPAGYTCFPLKHDIAIDKKGEEVLLEFTVSSSTTTPVNGLIKAEVVVNGITYGKSLTELKYNHIPYQLVLKDADVKIVPVDVTTKSKKIGFIPGAGDGTVEALEQLGYSVTELTHQKLTDENLSEYDAIITGVRAYNTDEKLSNFRDKLMDYINNGGNMIVQYNTNSNLGKLKGEIGPYPFTISRERVTDQTAEMRFTKPEHPLLNVPNKITTADFDNWVQERGIYFAKDFDKNYEAIFSCKDTTEKEMTGSTIVTKYGKGNFIYTGLALFRQLPAGVSGAYRLLVNMIELNKQSN
ncbi:MAG TPA: PIG-L family deacetylase [Bacteroidia bacterium]|nr:PIG-L family deacetylase [Bacteroidia bacterium]HNU34234.1 PIG-L family deacetylase [Bacteroidia bacterium]